jgi:hypothetical protein
MYFEGKEVVKKRMKGVKEKEVSSSCGSYITDVPLSAERGNEL